MKAVRVNQWGGPDAAVFENIALPYPGPGEVLARVRAASVNPVDWAIREGYLAEYVQAPITLGVDFAGDIEAVGEGVEGFQVGDAIYGAMGARGGAFAEFVVVGAGQIAKKPESLNYTEAASVPHTALTSWQMLFDMAQLREGQRVLVHAAAGGVGSFAVQFAKLKGAHVIGTASGQNESFVRSLGADEFVNYTAVPFETVVKGVDIVLDTVGWDTLERSYQVLKPGGTLVCIVTPPSPELAQKHDVQIKYLGAQPKGDQLAEIAKLIDGGKVKPHVSQIMKFDQVHEALQLSQARHIRGKLVLNIGV
jgi:NADPH:quinone reductase-like Zn-dependent oxidoreductase